MPNKRRKGQAEEKPISILGMLIVVVLVVAVLATIAVVVVRGGGRVIPGAGEFALADADVSACRTACALSAKDQTQATCKVKESYYACKSVLDGNKCTGTSLRECPLRDWVISQDSCAPSDVGKTCFDNDANECILKEQEGQYKAVKNACPSGRKCVGGSCR